ncbi:MAG: S1 RNA-binding domain-containing protein [Chloroflexi bacterium]|nr:S1 RNA-binding domain-containing protein [Chloroflexota bacterium]
MDSSTHSLESLSRYIKQASQRCTEDPEEQVAAAPDPSVEVSDQPIASDAQPVADAQPAAEGHPANVLDAAWENARQAFGDGRVVSGVVTGWNRGGLLVRWRELQGFVPASQLKEVPLFDEPEQREDTLSRWIGEELRLKVIELDRSRNRLVFSERATQWGPKDGEQVLREIVPGETRHGQVSNICDFGVFVDLGGVDGLIHLSELSWGRVSHPRDVLTIGEKVDVYVISVDRDARRIALSLKRLKPDPWSVVDQKYRPGEVLSAIITNVAAFGAFAQIEEGLEGLVHISEMSEIKISHPTEVVQPGDKVQVRILRIDSACHRLGLSMRMPREEPATGTTASGQADEDGDSEEEQDSGARATLLY